MSFLARASIANFRSITDELRLELDAPVVLVQGANGVGKTSILAAVELALTHEVAALQRADPSYRAHLVHKGRRSAELEVDWCLEGEGRRSARAEVRDARVSGSGELDVRRARFYTERCYLAQATLGRLLEIYEDSDTGADSALTRFVKELLGLDTLDALVDGLNAANDVRNIRRLSPTYATAEQRQRDTLAQMRRLSGQKEESRAQLESLKLAVAEIETKLSEEGDAPVAELREAATERRSELDRQRIRVAELRAFVTLLQQEPEPSEMPSRSPQVSAAEAKRLLDEWRMGDGAEFRSVLDRVRALLPEPVPRSADPVSARGSSLERISVEIQRQQSIIAETERRRGAAAERATRRTALTARVAELDAELASIGGTPDTGLLSDTPSILRAIAAHLEGDVCPVCERDYREVSDETLRDVVLRHAAALESQANQLRELRNTRARSISELRELEALNDEVSDERSEESARRLLESLTALQAQLDAMAAIALRGAELLDREASARRRLAASESQAADLDRLERDVRELAESLLDDHDPGESFIESLARMEHVLASLLSEADTAIQLTSELSALNERVAIAEQTAIQLADQLTLYERRGAAWEIAFDEAARVRAVARRIHRVADETRTAVIRRVFNDELNGLWADLFTRLAPTERFVPTFRLPAGQRSVTASLETVDRDGGSGGAPGAMLSAGNLNTAALTLFLALHLSVEPQIPCLVLDDPVQSMDDVHVAQFASLLRTISYEQGRQVVVAVHDQALFEYLALELSPPDQASRLALIRIADHNGVTRAECEYRRWVPDALAHA
jgi:exonuclease SbcC